MAGKKLALLDIGESKSPRCFTGIRSLPLEYSANVKAWMTGDLFSQWLEKWNRKLASKNRQVLLVTCHGDSSHLDVMNSLDKRVYSMSYISRRQAKITDFFPQ